MMTINLIKTEYQYNLLKSFIRNQLEQSHICQRFNLPNLRTAQNRL